MCIRDSHYNRINNPTNDVLEKRLAALEGGSAALVVASGMAAVSYSILTVAPPGSNFVVAPQLYGATYTYFAHVLPSLGITARFALDDRAESIAPLIDERTSCVFVESIGNPAGNVVDIEAVAEVAHRGGVPLIVDNTVATPMLLKPLHHGADVVVQDVYKRQVERSHRSQSVSRADSHQRTTNPIPLLRTPISRRS